VTTRRYIPEDPKLHTHRRENLKSHNVNLNGCREKILLWEKQMWPKLKLTKLPFKKTNKRIKFHVSFLGRSKVSTYILSAKDRGNIFLGNVGTKI
jgi:hypothetical protein